MNGEYYTKIVSVVFHLTRNHSANQRIHLVIHRECWQHQGKKRMGNASMQILLFQPRKIALQFVFKRFKMPRNRFFQNFNYLTIRFIYHTAEFLKFTIFPRFIFFTDFAAVIKCPEIIMESDNIRSFSLKLQVMLMLMFEHICQV